MPPQRGTPHSIRASSASLKKLPSPCTLRLRANYIWLSNNLDVAAIHKSFLGFQRTGGDFCSSSDPLAISILYAAATLLPDPEWRVGKKYRCRECSTALSEREVLLHIHIVHSIHGGEQICDDCQEALKELQKSHRPYSTPKQTASRSKKTNAAGRRGNVEDLSEIHSRVEAAYLAYQNHRARSKEEMGKRELEAQQEAFEPLTYEEQVFQERVKRWRDSLPSTFQPLSEGVGLPSECYVPDDTGSDDRPISE